MFIQSVSSSRILTSPRAASGSGGVDAAKATRVNEREFEFNIRRLVIAASLLVVILSFAIATAFFDQLAQIHTMLVHAFELVLGLIAGLLGGEAIAKAEKS